MSFRAPFQSVAVAAVAVLFALMSAAPDQTIRRRRSASTLCRAMMEYTDRDCLEYLNYGCFCGPGGTGDTPKDDVDQCCYQHDECYGSVHGCDFIIYFVYNKIQCSGGSCNCTDEDQTGCPYKLCRCDVVFAECLKEAEFNESLTNYNKKNCVQQVDLSTVSNR
ncbi:unnamed protein product [Lymnaea stagnalis]|uniref:Phospholipase A2 n=1 Tax=Lymnaea stagnalis TaxID=6523 RepID=A0AAV2HNT6_LYMST